VVLTERLVREAQAMAQVNHPNVVTVYEVGVAEDRTTFIAMELVTGESLRTWQTKARHTIPEIVAAYIAAGHGLAAAHAAGIIHRDFKPDNVLVGDDRRIRVTDFGLAAAKPNESRGDGLQTPLDVNLTTSGSVLGTPIPRWQRRPTHRSVQLLCLAVRGALRRAPIRWKDVRGAR
jgi:eukaryotic-like serine/threonine-protein kinase